jgi:hypothetical protein
MPGFCFSELFSTTTGGSARARTHKKIARELANRVKWASFDSLVCTTTGKYEPKHSCNNNDAAKHGKPNAQWTREQQKSDEQDVDVEETTKTKTNRMR